MFPHELTAPGPGGISVARSTAQRFKEIGGGSLGLNVSVELFTTMIPLFIIGFNYMSGVSDDVNPGKLIIRQLGLAPPQTERVRDAFGDPSALDNNWARLALSGFLLWGLPMSITIAGIFAKAWRRAEFTLGERLVRGAIWFLIYVLTIILREKLIPDDPDNSAAHTLAFLAGLIAVWLFWTLTPYLLVRNGAMGLRYLALAGLAGTAIDGVLIPLAARNVFPRLLEKWTGFGPIGVSMALITWCGVIGLGWVVTACVGAVLWERAAPPETVIASQH